MKIDFLDNMSYDSLKYMRDHDAAWRLLASNHAPFIASFLYAAFVAENNREIPEYTLITKLENFHNELFEDRDFSRSPKETLTRWSDGEHGWLRKFYPMGKDDVHYDLTSTAQRAIDWLVSLKQQSFIGTESRLIMVFKLLNEIIEQSDTDPERRINELERRKAEIEEEIYQAKLGNIKVLDSVQIKDRFIQAMNTSREILADFRAVEQNFRDLDRKMREQIASWDKGKGELLNAFFYEHDGIADSEQGKSFSAFYSFLMSKSDQDNFDSTIAKVLKLEPIQSITAKGFMQNVEYDWLRGSEHVQNTIAMISQQLKRYVDENFLEEERRIHQIVKTIESSAIALREQSHQFGDDFIELDAIRPDINLTFDRPLFTPPIKTKILDVDIVDGISDTDKDILYNQIYVDKNLLIQQISTLLSIHSEVTLSEVIQEYPLKAGLSELVTYISIAGQKNAEIVYDKEENIFWQDKENIMHKAKLPKITFRKSN